MRRTLSIYLLGALVAGAGLTSRAPGARADTDARGKAHAEMTAALEAQVDAYPAPALLPTALVPTTPVMAGPVRTATPAPARVPLDASARAADRIQQVLVGISVALTRQAQAAAQAAAGQARSQAAKERAERPKPGR